MGLAPAVGQMIVAGDGNAYLPYAYMDYVGSHLRVLVLAPDGTSNKVDLGDWAFALDNFYAPTMGPGTCGIWYYPGAYYNVPWLSVMTNGDSGAAILSELSLNAPCVGTPQLLNQISYVSQGSLTSQVTVALNPAVNNWQSNPVTLLLQREDGSYIGADMAGNLFAFGTDGTILWQKQLGAVVTPLYATADGGGIATSTPPCSQEVQAPPYGIPPCPIGTPHASLGTLYTVDRNGNVTSQTPDTGAILSWTNQWYLDPQGTVSSVSEPPVDFPQYLYLYKYYLTATDDYCGTNPPGRTVLYVLTNKADGSNVQNLKYFVYEVLSWMKLARPPTFPGTTVDYPNKFDDWIGLEYSGSSTQQFGIALARPNPSGAPGGQLIQIDWTRFGGSVLSENLISFEKFIPYINGVGCRSYR
jgi:hypothetical protein